MRRGELVAVLALTSAVTVGLAGCGGGGGGGSSGGAGQEIPVILGQPGPGDTGNYFLFTEGNFWHYRATSTDPASTPPFENGVSVAGRHAVGAAEAWELVESNPSGDGGPEFYSLVEDPAGIAAVDASTASDPVTRQLLPYWEFRFGLAAGESFLQLDRKALDFGEDLDLDGRNETVDIRSTVTYEGSGPITVAAGSYQEAAIFRRNMTLAVYLSSNGRQVAGSSQDRAWFVPNLGEVKSVSTLEVAGESETITEELDAYVVDGHSQAVETSSLPVVEGTVRAGQTRIYSLPADPQKGAVIALSGLTGDADLTVYSRPCAAGSVVGLPGTAPESCTLAEPGAAVFVGVTGREAADYVLSAAAVQWSGVPQNEGTDGPVQVLRGTPGTGSVATRGTSYYAAAGLPWGRHTVTIAGLTEDADLHVYQDETYSFELDCTLRSVGDVLNYPESCAVDATGSLYFTVTSGELNRDGAWYAVIVQ